MVSYLPVFPVGLSPPSTLWIPIIDPDGDDMRSASFGPYLLASFGPKTLQRSVSFVAAKKETGES